MPGNRLRSITALLLSVCATSTQAESPKWFAATTGGIVVMSNESGAAATGVLADVVGMRAAMKQLTGVESGSPLRVFALKGEAALRELLPQYWERRGVRPQAGSFAGPDRGFIAVRTDLPAAARFPILLHEYVHLLTAAHVTAAPAWLDEGLAEFWGSLVVDGDRMVVGRPPARHLRQLRGRKWLPLKDLFHEQRITLAANSSQVAMFYAQSWALVHYLIMGRDPSGPIVFAPSGLDVAESTLRAYVAEGRFREVVVPVWRTLPTAAVATDVSEARALAERADMLVFGERPAAALPLLRKALTIQPAEPQALETMGTYFFLQNQAETARDWLTRALEADGERYRSALYLAVLSSTNAERERYLMAAVRAKPDFALAWQRLWTVYEEDGRAARARRRLCDRFDALLRPWPWLGVSLRCGS